MGIVSLLKWIIINSMAYLSFFLFRCNVKMFLFIIIILLGLLLLFFDLFELFTSWISWSWMVMGMRRHGPEILLDVCHFLKEDGLLLLCIVWAWSFLSVRLWAFFLWNVFQLGISFSLFDIFENLFLIYWCNFLLLFLLRFLFGFFFVFFVSFILFLIFFSLWNFWPGFGFIFSVRLCAIFTCIV